MKLTAKDALLDNDNVVIYIHYKWYFFIERDCHSTF